MVREKKTKFLYKPTEEPKKCPKCGGEPTFEKDGETTETGDSATFRCIDCDFAWIKYYQRRFESWVPLGED